MCYCKLYLWNIDRDLWVLTTCTQGLCSGNQYSFQLKGSKIYLKRSIRKEEKGGEGGGGGGAKK